MRRFAVLAAVVTALGLGAAMAGSTPARSPLLACAKGSLRAVINGKQTCLKAGQGCAKRLDRQYHRYKFHCHAGRLTRKPAQRPVPLTPLTIELMPMDGSGVSGTATLTPMGALKTKVTIEIPNPPGGSLASHIHYDRCTDGGTIFYGLPNVIGGHSETEVGAIAPLRRHAFSVNVHSGSDPVSPIIACGDIPRA